MIWSDKETTWIRVCLWCKIMWWLFESGESSTFLNLFLFFFHFPSPRVLLFLVTIFLFLWLTLQHHVIHKFSFYFNEYWQTFSFCFSLYNVSLLKFSIFLDMREVFQETFFYAKFDDEILKMAAEKLFSIGM